MSLVTPYIHLTATRYMQVAATALLSYDYLLTLKYEIEHFWSPKVSWASILFFSNRYFALFTLTLNTGALLSPGDTDKFCMVWVKYLVTGFGAMEIFIVQGILIARIHAMYRGSRVILTGLLAFYVASMASAVTVVALSVRNNIVTAHPAPGLVVCASLSPPNHIWAFWIPILAFEGSLFGLAIRKAFLHLYKNPFKGRTSTMQVLEIMIRDSVIYFLLIFIAYTVNALIWRFAAADLLDVVHGFTLATVSISGTRMMLNLREKRYLAVTESGVELLQFSKTNVSAS